MGGKSTSLDKLSPEVTKKKTLDNFKYAFSFITLMSNTYCIKHKLSQPRLYLNNFGRH